MSASQKAMEAQPEIFKLPNPGIIECYPALGDCQKCHQVVDLSKGVHICGR